MIFNQVVLLLTVSLFFAASCISLRSSYIDTVLIPKEVASGFMAAEKLSNVYEAYNKEFTPKEKYYLGRAVVARLLSKYSIYGNGNSDLEEYVKAIGWTLAMASEQPDTFQGYRFIIISSEKPNIFSAPSGYILITTALLKLTSNEEELAGVLAHAITRIVYNHPSESIKEKEKSEAIAQLAKFAVKTSAEKDPSLSSLVISFENVINNTIVCNLKGLNEVQIKEADIKSVELLIETGYNPYGLSSILKKLPNNNNNGELNFLNRAEEVEKKINKFKNIPKTLTIRTERFKKAFQNSSLP